MSSSEAKKVFLCNAYREWQVPGIENSLSVADQLSRWQVFLGQWEKAAATGLEIIVLGDMNLNHLNWQEKDYMQSKQTKKLRPLIEELFTRIIPYGFSQLVRVATRHFPGQLSSGLDHVYTNSPQKIQEVQVFHWGGSDHMMVIAIRRAKAVLTMPSYVRKRSYKYFDPSLYLNMVRATS